MKVIIQFFATSTQKTINHLDMNFLEDLSLPYLWVSLSLLLEIAWKIIWEHSLLCKSCVDSKRLNKPVTSSLDYVLVDLLDQTGAFLLHTKQISTSLLGSFFIGTLQLYDYVHCRSNYSWNQRVFHPLIPHSHIISRKQIHQEIEFHIWPWLWISIHNVIIPPPSMPDFELRLFDCMLPKGMSSDHIHTFLQPLYQSSTARGTL